jgi:Fe-S cluster assembly iron-binding protein IscA
MLKLTEAARTHLAQILDQTEAPSDMTIRFVPAEGNRLIVYLDYTRPEDTRFVHHGKVVLVLDPQAAHAMTQRTIDLQQGRNAEPRFVCC